MRLLPRLIYTAGGTVGSRSSTFIAYFVAKEKHSGRLIGIEINELVSAEAIRTKITAKTPESAYYHWTHRDVLDALQEYLMTRMLRSTKTDLPMRFMW
jgi:Arc/MetJ family transcription regulator